VLLVGGAFPALSETFIAAHFTGLLDRGVDAHYWGSPGDAAAWAAYPGLAEKVRGRLHVHAPSERPLRTARDVLTGRIDRRVIDAARGQAAGVAARRLLAGARLAAIRPDLIHFEFGLGALGMTWMGDVADCPLVVSMRGYDVNYAGLDQPGYFDEVWDRVDALHCLGEDMWQRSLRRGCPPEMPHRLIPPAVDVSRFSAEREERDGRLVVLTVARLHWKKGHEYGLQAIRALVDDGVGLEYRVVGTGPYADAVQACVDDLGLRRHVRLLGALPPAAVREELRGADVFLHPAVSEGFGNAVMEAQAAALPVVCTDADGLRENVADGETGFAVPRRDPQALAAALARLAGDRELRRAMGEAGRRRVGEHFDPARQIDAFVALYEDTITAASRRPRRSSPPSR
jgi:colanic acid/amylovoran biosynthesis glycosyltransferase